MQPNVVVVPPVVIIGRVLSDVHLTVRDVVAVLLHPSIAVKVLVLARLQPSEVIAPSEEVIVVAPQLSVALAEPSEPVGSVGLQPRVTSA